MEDPPANKEQGISVRREHFVEWTESLFMDEKTADFWFSFGSDVNQVRIPVHKVMLAKESEAFNAMFYGEMKEKNNEVEIVDASHVEFTEFAQFFYTDKITITIKNLFKLMYLATKYLVIDLLKVCDEFIIEHFSPDKLILGYDLAILYDRFELRTKLEQKISESPREFFATNTLSECSYDTLRSVLHIDQLMWDPKDVFDACINWAKNKRKNYDDDLTEMDNIKKQLGECLYRIPFYLMSSEQISEIVNDYEELFDRGEIVELMNMMSVTRRIDVKKFKYHDEFAPYYQSNWRLWWRLGLTEESRKWIRRHETVHLSYSNKIVLKAIQPFYFWYVGSVETQGVKILSGVMRIVSEKSRETILLKQPFSLTCRENRLCTTMPTIKLVKPIIFEPLTSYKILFDFDDSWSEETFFTLKTSTDNNDNFVPLICYDKI